MNGLDQWLSDNDFGLLSINSQPDGKFLVFTCPTQHFYVDSLDELTPERFEREKIQNQTLWKQTMARIDRLYRSGGMDP